MNRKLLLLAILLFSSCGQTYDYSNIKVRYVIDGDTVKLANGETLRYIGIDTPETKIKEGGEFIYKPQPFALEAKNLNKKLVEGKTVSIEFDVEKKDTYGRLLGYCFLKDGTFVNNELVKNGLATIYTYPPNVKYTNLLYKSQVTAREQKQGLWGAYETITADKVSSYLNQIRTVRGTVKNTRQTKKCFFLNFDTPKGKKFKIVIFKNTHNYFSDKGIDLETFYTGKTIEVSGRIRRYKNSYEIIANTPEDIKIISN